MKYYFRVKKHYLYKEVTVMIQNKEDLMLAADVLYYCIITPIFFLAAAADGTITLNQHSLSLIILIAFFI